MLSEDETPPAIGQNRLINLTYIAYYMAPEGF